MEKEIELLKKEYLATSAPMDEVAGFSDVLIRLEKLPKTRPIYPFAFLVLIIVITGFAVFLLIPENPTVSALKSSPIFKDFFKPSVTPIPSVDLKTTTPKKAHTPTPTKTPTPTVAPAIKTPKIQPKENSSNASPQVKGVSEEHKSNNANGQSEDKKNEKSKGNAQLQSKNPRH